jgi:hypothetical protein
MGWFSTEPVRDPYTQAKGANQLAGRNASALGKYGQGFIAQGQQSALDKYKPAGTAYDSLYGPNGSQKGPGAYEQLYTQRQAGTDPYYNRIAEQGLGRLGQAAAARGNFNSGGAMAGEGAFLADLGAKQAHEMADFAKGAQDFQMKREGGAFDAAMGLGGAQAGITERGTAQQWGALSQGEMTKIQQDLAAAGVDISKFQNDQQAMLAIWGILGGTIGTVAGS